jgi:hypothetical protein
MGAQQKVSGRIELTTVGDERGGENSEGKRRRQNASSVGRECRKDSRLSVEPLAPLAVVAVCWRVLSEGSRNRRREPSWREWCCWELEQNLKIGCRKGKGNFCVVLCGRNLAEFDGCLACPAWSAWKAMLNS